MATTRRRKRDELPRNVTFVLNGKDWYDCTEEEKDAWRNHVAKVSVDVAINTLEERYGKSRVASALRVFMYQWKAEQAGHAERLLGRLLEKGSWPLVIEHLLGTFIEASEVEPRDEEVANSPPRYAI